MAIFNLNFKKIRENVNAFNKDINKYKNTISMLHGTLVNVDTTWNDVNTLSFISGVKQDYRSFSAHLDSISKYVLLINSFCENIQLVISRQFGVNRIDYLKYSSTTLNTCISKLDQIYNLLNNTINLFYNIAIPVDFRYRKKLESYRSNFYNMKESISLLRKKLLRINNDIVAVINDYKLRVNKIDFVNIDKKKMNYRWRTQRVQLRKNIKNDLQTSSRVQENFSNETSRSMSASVNISPQQAIEKSDAIEILDVENPEVFSVTNQDAQTEFLNIKDENFVLDEIGDLSINSHDKFLSAQGINITAGMKEKVSNPTEKLNLKTELGEYEIPKEEVSNSKHNDIEFLE